MRWKFWFATLLTVIVTLLLAGCFPPEPPPPPHARHAAPPPTPSITLEEFVRLDSGGYVATIHDAKRAVTCYLHSTTIYCLPDSALAKPPPESAPTK